MSSSTVFSITPPLRSIKRALHSIKRALHSTTRAFNSTKIGLRFVVNLLLLLPPGPSLISFPPSHSSFCLTLLPLLAHPPPFYFFPTPCAHLFFVLFGVCSTQTVSCFLASPTLERIKVIFTHDRTRTSWGSNRSVFLLNHWATAFPISN